MFFQVSGNRPLGLLGACSIQHSAAKHHHLTCGKCCRAKLYSLHCASVHFNGFVHLPSQQMHLPQCQESSVVLVQLQSCVQMLLRLGEREEEQLWHSLRGRTFTWWRKLVYSHVWNPLWRSSTHPDYGWSPGGKRKAKSCMGAIASANRITAGYKKWAFSVTSKSLLCFWVVDDVFSMQNRL